MQEPANVPIGNPAFAGSMEAAGIEPANDSYRQLSFPTPKLLARYPENLPYLVYHSPPEHYKAGGLDLRPLYAEDGGSSPTSLYAIQVNAPGGPIKIGVAVRPQARLEQLQVGCPYPLTLVTSIPATTRIERKIHKHFEEYRREGEWFDPAAPVLELVAELFDIGLMIEDYREVGCELDLRDLVAIIAETDAPLS